MLLFYCRNGRRRTTIVDLSAARSFPRYAVEATDGWRRRHDGTGCVRAVADHQPTRHGVSPLYVLCYFSLAYVYVCRVARLPSGYRAGLAILGPGFGPRWLRAVA